MRGGSDRTGEILNKKLLLSDLSTSANRSATSPNHSDTSPNYSATSPNHSETW